MRTQSLATSSLLLITVLVQCQASQVDAATTTGDDVTTIAYETTTSADERYEYNVACPLPPLGATPGQDGCNLYIQTGRIAADVVIRTKSSDLSFRIAANESYRYIAAAGLIVNVGLQEKRITVFVNTHVTVVMLTYDYRTPAHMYVDATEISAYRESGYQFYPISYSTTCPVAKKQAYYTIVANRKHTLVAIYADGKYIEAKTLFNFHTYTVIQTATDDLSKHYIVATEPVSVFAGATCTDVTTQGSYVSTVPPVDVFSYDFLTSPLGGHAGAKYTVRVVASEDDTLIDRDGVSQTRNAGQIVIYDMNGIQGSSITCNKKCQVFQFAQFVKSSFGSFMFHVIPNNRFYYSTFFSNPHYGIARHYITITTSGGPPYDGFALDGDSLNNATWVDTSRYGFLIHVVSEGYHEVRSSNRAFAVYAYGHTNAGGGYGFVNTDYHEYDGEISTTTGPSTPRPEGNYVYLVACVPTHVTSSPGVSSCKLTIASDVMTKVTISSYDISYVVEVYPMSPYVKTLPERYHMVAGLATRGVLIRADVELFITLMKGDNPFTGQFIDMTSIHDQRSAGTQFYIVQSNIADNLCTGATYTKNFYSVAAYEDDTFVEISKAAVYYVTENLNTYQTWTSLITATVEDDTGVIIRSTRPVMVFSGTLCVTDAVSGTYMSTLPPLNMYADEFNIPFISASSRVGYTVRVIAKEDNTEVRDDLNIVKTIGKGVALDIKYTTNNEFKMITCSKDCLAVFFQKSIENVAGNFMMVLTPTRRFYSNQLFYTLDVVMAHYVTIIVTGYGPMDDIHLDDRPLGDKLWASRGNYSVTALPITSGLHRVYSTSQRLLCIYVYGHSGNAGGGYGFPVLGTDD